MPKLCASGTRTVRTCKHKHSCILRASPRPPTPNAVQVVHARGQDRYIARAVHAKTLRKWYKHSTYVQAQALMCTTHAAQANHAIYCTTHAYTYSRRVIQRSGCTCRLPYTHTHTYKIHCSNCPSRTPYRTYTQKKCSPQAPE